MAEARRLLAEVVHLRAVIMEVAPVVPEVTRTRRAKIDYSPHPYPSPLMGGEY